MSLNSELEQTYRRRPQSWLVTAWAWLFNLTLYGLLGLVVFNINRIAIRARLAGESSLFGSFFRLLLVGAALLLLTSAVHELGHLLGGWLAKLRFYLLVVGPIKISRETGKLRFGLSRGGAFNGLAACIPEKIYDLRRRMLLFALGGPVASLLLALLAGGVFYRLPTGVPAWVGEGAAITAVSSLIFFLTSMKPGTYPNGMPADGGRILMLLQNGAEARRWCALVALNSADVQGQRPRDWDETMVQQAMTGLDASSEGMMARLLVYQWAVDNGRFSQANLLLDDAFALRASRFPGAIGRFTLEKAYLLALHQNNPAEGREWLERLRRRSTKHPLSCRAEAAVLLREGQLSAAHAKATIGLDTLRHYPQTGANLAEAAWLQTILDQTTGDWRLEIRD